MPSSLQLTEFSGYADGYQYRPSLCREFQRLLSSSPETEILLLEARPGIGATSLCAEYFDSVQDPAILLTVHARSRPGYSLPYLLEQALRQASDLLGEDGKLYKSENIISEWQRTLPKLSRKVRAARQKLHIIIDGLYQIPSEDQRYQNEVINEILLLGNPDIKHILTWSENDDLPPYLRKGNTRRAAIPALNDHEVAAYLISQKVNSFWLDEITASTGGVPAKLTAIARLNALGKLDTINIKSSLTDYYDIELEAIFSKAKIDKDGVERALSFIVFSKRPLTISDVVSLSQISNEVARDIICTNGFFEIDSVSTTISFASNTHREYLQRRLTTNRSAVIRTFVDILIKDPLSSDSVQLLPTYYNDLGEFAQTVSMLTADNLDTFLAETQSIAALKQRNDLGLSAATRSKQEVEAFRFALQSSIIRSLDARSDNEALLAALAATDRLDQALQVAESEATNEGKLLLLAQYVSLLHERGLRADTLIFGQIENLTKGLQLAANRNNAITIAEYLVGPYPDLAFKVVEECSNGESDFRDAAYTRLAINETKPFDESKNTKSNINEYTSRISNSNAQAFVKAVEAVISERAPDDLFESTQGMDGRQRSFFLRQWLGANYKAEGAIRVACAAMDEAASDASYAPLASDLRIICLPLMYTADRSAAEEVLQRIEIQRTSLLERASTVDRVRLDIAIARVKVSLGQANADSMVEDIYLNVSYLSDDGVRLECYCWLQSQLERFASLTENARRSLEELVGAGIQESVERCLLTTAEHVDVFKGAVSALVEFNPKLACDIISKINTNYRRNIAYGVLIQQLLLRRSNEPIPVALVKEAIFKITDDGRRWVAITNCLRILGKAKPILDESPTALFSLLSIIEDPLGLAYCLIFKIKVCEKYGVALDTEEVSKRFNENIVMVDEAWMTPALNFELIEAIAQIDKAHANKLLDEFWKSDARLKAQSAEYCEMLQSLCRLTMISFAGTLKHHQDTEETFQTLLGTIGRVTPLQAQANILSDLAIRAHAASRRDILDKVCSEHLLPLVRNQNGANRYIARNVIEESFTALFLWNAAVANSFIDALPLEQKDGVRSDAVHYLIRRIPPTEPYDDENLKNARVNWADAMMIVEQIEHMKTDNWLVPSIYDFCFAATSKGSIQEINSSQRSEIARRLLRKTESALPDPNNIQHDGWKILAKGACLKLVNEVGREKWESLISDAKAIPNTSDSVYILITLAACMPGRLQPQINAAAKEAEARIRLIPSKIDSVRRAVSLSRLSSSADYENEMAKRILRNAMLESMSLKDQDAMLGAQRSILDQAYKIDVDFAEELVKGIDDDPARNRAVESAKRRLAQQKAKGAFIEKKYDLVGKHNDYSAMGWQTLAGLNAGNVPGQRQEELSAMLPKVAQKNLEDSLGFYWLYLRSLQRRYEHSALQSKLVLVPILEMTGAALLLAERVGGRVWGNQNLDSRYFDVALPASDSFVGVPGSGRSGIDYIRQWIEEQSSNVMLICDPYFKPENIDFIKDIAFHRENMEFYVLTCNNEIATQDLDTAYRGAWSNLAHIEPPPIRIVHLTYEGPRASSAHVIHDRWIFMGAAGLRIGTSVGSLSGTKLFEVSRVSAGESSDILSVLTPFVEMKTKSLDAKRLRYTVVQW